jgi:hypothetical protein
VPGALSYMVSYGTNESADNVGIILTNTNTCSIDSLNVESVYYFKIASSNESSLSGYSAIISFRTPIIFYYYYITPTIATNAPGDPVRDFNDKYTQGGRLTFFGSVEAVTRIQATSMPAVTEPDCHRKTIQELYVLTNPNIINYGFDPSGW